MKENIAQDLTRIQIPDSHFDQETGEILPLHDSHVIGWASHKVDNFAFSLKKQKESDYYWRSRPVRLEDVETSHIKYDPESKTLKKYTTVTKADKLNYKPLEQVRPIAEAKIYRQDVVFSTTITNAKRPLNANSTKRGAIKEFSKGAVKRCKLFFRNVPEESYKVFITLTYPEDYSNDGKQVKYHLKQMKMWLKRNGVKSGAWWLEFQKRGAAHFHLVVDEWVSPERVAAAWVKITKSGCQKHYDWHAGYLSGRSCVEWIRKPHAISAYVTKYASKQEQKAVPEEYQNVGRFWGYWGKIRPEVRYLYGKGVYPVAKLREAYQIWSLMWKYNAGFNVDGLHVEERTAGTFWGGAYAFESLLDQVEWCPF